MVAGEIIPVGDVVALDVILMKNVNIRDWLIYKIYFCVSKSIFLCFGFMSKKSYLIANGIKKQFTLMATFRRNKGQLESIKGSKNAETQCMRKRAE